MPYSVNINPGQPPLIWSNVLEAFNRVNENFEIIQATLGDSGITPIDFTDLNSSVIPADTNRFSLGSDSKTWTKLYISQWADTPETLDHGLWLGTAQVRGISGSIDLPNGSTVNGNLIIDPNKTAFKSIAVSGQDTVIADSFEDTLTLVGNAINITTNSTSDTITFTNSGVTSASAGPGITVSGSNSITITNSGVRSITNTTPLPSGLAGGSGISVDSSSGDIRITNTGVLSIESNTASLVVSTDTATGIVTISNNAPAGPAFRYIEVDGDGVNLVESNSTGGTVKFISGNGISLDKNALSDEVTFNVNPRFDLVGSVFSDDSTKLIDAVNSQIFAIGGFFGDLKGSVFGDDSTKIVDAVENKLYAEEITTTNGFITDLRSPTFRAKDIYAIDSFGVNISANGFNNLVVLETSVELQNVPVNVQNNVNITGTLNVGTIDTVDSSAITVVPPVNFNTDVNFENELFIQNSRVMAIDELKNIVAASTDFANFQARIAAL